MITFMLVAIKFSFLLIVFFFFVQESRRAAKASGEVKIPGAASGGEGQRHETDGPQGAAGVEEHPPATAQRAKEGQGGDAEAGEGQAGDQWIPQAGGVHCGYYKQFLKVIF